MKTLACEMVFQNVCLVAFSYVNNDSEISFQPRLAEQEISFKCQEQNVLGRGNS